MAPSRDLEPRDLEPGDLEPGDMARHIEQFLAGGPHAVVGASTDRSKYGNRVLRAYIAEGRKVYPVNPKAPLVEGLESYPTLEALPEAVHGLSVVTPPEVSDGVIREAGRLGIRWVWLQPGAESRQSAQVAAEAGVNLIAGGPCILVEFAA